MASPIEVRSSVDQLSVVRDGGKKYIRGYAAVFNSPSEVMTTPSGRAFREIIKPGAFSRSLLESDVRGLFNHKSDIVLGRRSAGTLKLGEDQRGLWYQIDPPKSRADVVESLERGDITGSSFAFATVDDFFSVSSEGETIRELRSVHLFDVGPVVFPAYLEASAAYRSLDEHLRVTSTRTYPTPQQKLALLRLL